MLWRRLRRDPFWSTVVSGLIGVLVGALLERILGNPWLTSLVAILVIFALWFLLRHPIKWNFDNFLAAAGGGGRVLIEGFQASGVNRSRATFKSVSGKLVSLMDNSESEPLQFVMNGQPVDASTTSGIPSGARFQVMIRLTDPTAGPDDRLTPHEFRKRWATFRFVVELDGLEFQRRFSRRSVDRVIEQFDRVANPRPEPEVKLKNDDV